VGLPTPPDITPEHGVVEAGVASLAIDAPELIHLQRRTLRVLVASQILAALGDPAWPPGAVVVRHQWQ